MIDDVSRRYTVDPKRIFVTGHSNGVFMAHRLACDRTSRIAGVVAFAGDVWKDPARRRPDAAVSVLQLHGNADATVAYGGGSLAGPYNGNWPVAVYDWMLAHPRP